MSIEDLLQWLTLQNNEIKQDIKVMKTGVDKEFVEIRKEVGETSRTE